MKAVSVCSSTIFVYWKLLTLNRHPITFMIWTNKKLWWHHKRWSQDCMSKKQEWIILVLEKKLKKEEKEHIWVEERQLAFRVHLRLLKIVDSEQASNYFYDMNNAKSKSAERYLSNNDLHLLKIVGSWQVSFIDV